jgi:PAS domain S-box-containing protein
MLKFYLNKYILTGFILALTILSWLGISSYLNTKSLIKSSHMVIHTLDVLYNTERVLAITTNIELGQRGYSLTGVDEFLQPYHKATLEIEKHVENLKGLTSDNIRQQERINKLEGYISQLLQFSSAAIEYRKKTFEASRDFNATMEGKKLMDGIRAAIQEIETEENALLKTRNESNEIQIEKFNNNLLALLVTSVAILMMVFFAVNFVFRTRFISQEKLRLAYDEIKDLYDNAPCGYHSLDEDGKFVNINDTLLRWLGYEKEEVLGKMKFTEIIPEAELPFFYERFREFKIKGLVYNLEFNLKRKDETEFPVLLSAIAIKDANGNYIKSRSITVDNSERKQAEAKIRNLNKELEAFTYSVSHDLRAPLRYIDGYSKILEEDYYDKLDNEGKRVIKVIMSNARRMRKLIDDLLQFAKLGRKDVSRSRLNMTQLVNAIVKEQLEQEPERRIEIKIDPLASAVGDGDMIRQVWENLISNAIKYTGKTAHAAIEISSEVNSQEVQYRIHDNGVGFDMQYAGKLFGVFQRLHKIQDFAGTGVGLAIVKRVIDRHNGRVWAEGALNKGASFYFTIPNENGK